MQTTARPANLDGEHSQNPTSNQISPAKQRLIASNGTAERPPHNSRVELARWIGDGYAQTISPRRPSAIYSRLAEAVED
jgi:hypothetical protein